MSMFVDQSVDAVSCKCIPTRCRYFFDFQAQKLFPQYDVMVIHQPGRNQKKERMKTEREKKREWRLANMDDSVCVIDGRMGEKQKNQ